MEKYFWRGGTIFQIVFIFYVISIFEVIIIFVVIFIFEIIFVFDVVFIWHCSANLKNLVVSKYPNYTEFVSCLADNFPF